jgi:hypothetical protein
MKRTPLALCALLIALGGARAGKLEQGFRNPPESCRPTPGWYLTPAFAETVKSCPDELRPAFERALAHGAVSVTPEEVKRMAAWQALTDARLMAQAKPPETRTSQPWDPLREPLDDLMARLAYLCGESQAVGAIFTQAKSAHGVTIYPPTPGFYLARRKVGDADLYLAVIQRKIDTVCTVTFPRLAAPELWTPQDGSVRTAPSYYVQDKSTAVNLRLAPYQALFIVLRRPPAKNHVKFASSLRITEVADDGSSVTGLVTSNGRCAAMFANGTMETAVVKDLPPPLEMTSGWSMSTRSPAERQGVGIAALRWRTVNLDEEKPKDWASPDFDDSAWRKTVIGGETEVAVRGPQWQAHWLTWDGARQERLFRKTFPLDEKPELATVTLTADNGYELFVNGERVGADGTWNQAETYDVAKALRTGKNVFAVRNTNAASLAGLLLEARIRLPSGQFIRIVTDGSWRMTKTAPAGWTKPDFDDTDWGKPTVGGTPPVGPWNDVPGLPEDPAGGQVTWYRFDLPAGAKSIRLPQGLKGAKLFVHARPVPLQEGAADLANDVQTRPRQAALRLPGHGAIENPILCQCEHGAAGLGNWLLVGYPTYSGLADYRATVNLPATYAKERLVLDLGTVACAARVTWNGKAVGTALWRPWLLDITEAARAGANQLQITVANTAANARATELPAERLAAGLIGPVRIRPWRQVTLGAK